MSTENESKHFQFGKMAEVTNHWNTAGHPAFKKIRVPPSKQQKDGLTFLNFLVENANLMQEPNLWVATEKVHGSNMSFVIFPNLDVKCAKREDFLDDENPDHNNTFFGYLKVKKQLENAAKTAFVTLKEKFIRENTKPSETGTTPIIPTVTRLTIYGELFGGVFPGLATPPDVKMCVQDGLYYSPDLHYMAFDACIHYTFPPSSTSTSVSKNKKANDRKNNNDDDDDAAASQTENEPNAEVEYLPFLPTMKILYDCGFPLVALPLAIGSYEDCSNFDIDFATTIPERLGPKFVPKESRVAIAASNRAEGIVCRTNIPQKVPLAASSSSKGNKVAFERCLFKRKKSDFASWCDKRAADVGGSNSTSQLTDEKSQALHFLANQFLTKHVVDSAVSKCGRPSASGKPKMNEQIMKALQEHVVDDCIEALDLYFYDSLSSSSSSSSASSAKGKHQKNNNKQDGKERKSGQELFDLYSNEISLLAKNKIGEFL